MLQLCDKKTFFQDRYQVIVLPVAISGVYGHRQLLKIQSLYPDHHIAYKNACQRGQLGLGDILLFEPQRDIAGVSMGGLTSKPKFMVDMGVTEFSENAPHLLYLTQCLQKLSPILLRWGRYEGIRRVAILASDELIVPANTDFETDILPLLEKYLMPMAGLNVMVYR